MITKDEIRTTLSDIRFYYANIKSFQNASKYVGENIIVKKAEKYSKAIEVAPPKLYELYIHLCKPRIKRTLPKRRNLRAFCQILA